MRDGPLFFPSPDTCKQTAQKIKLIKLLVFFLEVVHPFAAGTSRDAMRDAREPVLVVATLGEPDCHDGDENEREEKAWTENS